MLPTTGLPNHKPQTGDDKSVKKTGALKQGAGAIKPNPVKIRIQI
jgi:hypothetical protein